MWGGGFHGVGEVLAHAQYLRAMIWHWKNVTRIRETGKKKNMKRMRKVWGTDALCSGRCGISRLRKAESLSQSGWSVGVKKMTQRQRHRLSLLNTSAASVLSCWVDSRTFLNCTSLRLLLSVSSLPKGIQPEYVFWCVPLCKTKIRLSLLKK